MNYGIILYQRGIKKNEEKQQKVEKIKKELMTQDLQNCTHVPQINEISKVIAKRPQEKIGDYLNRNAVVIQEKLEQARNEKIKNEFN